VEVGVPEARYGWSDTAADRYFNEMMRRGKGLAAQVDRHCDGEDRAEVKFDIRYECKLCKRDWEMYEGFPTCCNEAVAAWEAAIEAA